MVGDEVGFIPMAFGAFPWRSWASVPCPLGLTGPKPSSNKGSAESSEASYHRPHHYVGRENGWKWGGSKLTEPKRALIILIIFRKCCVKFICLFWFSWCFASLFGAFTHLFVSVFMLFSMPGDSHSWSSEMVNFAIWNGISYLSGKDHDIQGVDVKGTFSDVGGSCKPSRWPILEFSFQPNKDTIGYIYNIQFDLQLLKRLRYDLYIMG